MPLGTKTSQALDEHTLNFGLKIRSGPKGPGFGAPKSGLTGSQCIHDEPSEKSFVVFSWRVVFFLGGGFWSVANFWFYQKETKGSTKGKRRYHFVGGGEWWKKGVQHLNGKMLVWIGLGSRTLRGDGLNCRRQEKQMKPHQKWTSWNLDILRFQDHSKIDSLILFLLWQANFLLRSALRLVPLSQNPILVDDKKVAYPFGIPSIFVGPQHLALEAVSLMAARNTSMWIMCFLDEAVSQMPRWNTYHVPNQYVNAVLPYWYIFCGHRHFHNCVDKTFWQWNKPQMLPSGHAAPKRAVRGTRVVPASGRKRKFWSSMDPKWVGVADGSCSSTVMRGMTFRLGKKWPRLRTLQKIIGTKVSTEKRFSVFFHQQVYPICSM